MLSAHSPGSGSGPAAQGGAEDPPERQRDVRRRGGLLPQGARRDARPVRIGVAFDPLFWAHHAMVDRFGRLAVMSYA